jgi:hypothetical protein
MNLREKVIQICEELSDKETIIEPKEVTLSKGIQDYYRFKPKKRFQFFNNFPILKLSINYGKPTLISYSREYDKKIEGIAKREDFAYIFDKVNQFTGFL